jgi:hypothetical protein
MLAYDYPILSLFWTMLLLFLWVLWFFLLFRTIVDIFRSDDLGGFAKTLWLIFVIVLPFLGVFVYVIARGNGMTRRDIERAQANEAQFRSYVQEAAGSSSGGSAAELAQLADLRDRGVITDDEFAQQKAKLLAR